MSTALVLPRYGEASIADVVGSVCDGLAVPGAWDVLGLGPAHRVVVVVIDGLGHHQLAEHSDLAPVLSAGQRTFLTSCVPSTTPAALTSIGTGRGPGSHGLVGAAFLLPETGRILAPLGWGSEPEPRMVQPESTWWERAHRAGVDVTVVGPRAYLGSGLTTAALRGGAHVGADGPGERVAEIAQAARRGDRSLVYGYWEFLDRAAHMHGVASRQYRAELVAVDRWVAQIADELPPGTRLVITSDHGVVDCPRMIDLDSLHLWDDVDKAAGEPRFRHVYTRHGERVAARWQAELGDAAVVMTRERACDAGWFGPVEPDVRGRIGDVVAAATGTVRLGLPSRDAAVSGLLGQHGSLTPAEMDVPLVVLES